MKLVTQGTPQDKTYANRSSGELSQGDAGRISGGMPSQVTR